MATDESGPSAARLDRVSQGPDVRSSSVAGAQGLIRLMTSVALISESGARVPITAGAIPVEVAVGSSGRALLGRDSVPVGRYTGVRITFTRVEADVQGLVLVTGVPFSGSVEVDLGAGPLVVEAQVPVTVEENDPSAVVIELNSRNWLSLAHLLPTIPPTARVTSTAFQGAISVRVE